MLVVDLARCVAVAVPLVTIACQSAGNMIETAVIRRDKTALGPISIPSGSSPADRLRAMKRTDLLRLFANSRSPTPSELREWFSSDENNDNRGECRSEWNGELLDNNSAVMKMVTSVITHGLFGGQWLPWRLVGKSSEAKGRWIGKAFGKPTTTATSGRGINRFDSATSPSGFQRHTFEYDIVESKILPGDGSLSLMLDYSNHQSLPISLWASMRDELRVIELPPNRNTKDDGDTSFVLLGMGSMGWSGGPLNCTPFLLERCHRKRD